MSGRGHGPPSSGMIRHGSYPHHSDSKPSAELERLVLDNQKLATTHVALRQDLVATKQDVEKLRAHIGSIQNESEIQIRLLLDKIAKMEVDIQAGENVRNELQRAHTEARALVVTRQDLIGQIEKAKLELEKVRANVEKLPEMQIELDGLRQEHQKLRSSFEHEKNSNMEKSAEMEVMDKDLLEMGREVERLRSEVLNAEKRATAPNMHGGPYMTQEMYHAPPMNASGSGYVHMGVGPYGGGHPRVAGPNGRLHWGPSQMVPYGVGHAGLTTSGTGRPQWRGPLSYNN